MSRFLGEIPDELVDMIGAEKRKPWTRGWDDTRHHFGDEPLLVNVVPGDEVLHEAFGVGRVVDIKGAGSDAEVTVRFEEGEKRLMLAYANLTKP
jgi:hypothetical protein